MAKLSLITRNDKRRKMRDKYHKKREALKNIVHDRSKSPAEVFEAQLKLQTIPRNASPVRVRNRCAITGRGRGNYRKFNMSRIKFRELASAGYIVGVVKSSW